MTEHEPQIYRCTECGKVSVSLSWIHAHAEKHHSTLPNLIPNSLTVSDPDQLNEYIEVIHIKDWETERASKAKITNGGEIRKYLFY